MQTLNNVNFANLNGGELPRRFTQEFSRILEDIDNDDKPTDSKRSIIIQIDFEPGETGENAIVTISSKLKLPAVKKSDGMIGLDHTPRGINAVVLSDGQKELFEQEEEDA